ncbi:Ser-Thr-rich glycosyl-phosphatidyl-inositol-anchored membrane family-domain-containing protein [Aspergillus leporis]|uniref:Ser-Thr-rich glycosyl-phosphatidyl-inositol-anchored membrane family-domain-containing protein n=1 Tax=Aspergillus leporis TaxID=41062 RepID=A0A5N5WZV6_9EURO|nr:Ser-Thr-rich glycosyl-phosphatidyl-inositol-anchored membrane family-domain-containing protein [Aspergillus leporis]
MRLFQLASLVAYATFAIALTITTPQNGDKVDFSKPYEVKWTTVASDPDTFTLILFSSASPNNQKVVTKEAKSSDGSYTIDKLWDIKIGNGYQFNIISNSTHNTGILAQSQTFNVTKVADKPVTSKQDFTKPTITNSSSSSPSCTSTKVTTTSRPCIIHNTFSTSISSPSSRVPCSPPSSTAIPSSSINKATSATHSATQTVAAPTGSTAGSAALTIPAAGSLVLSLFALVL